MGFFQNFPYSNHHNMNMDWILQKIREAVDTATAASKTANETVEIVNKYLAELDLSVEAKSILEDMYNNGKLSELVALYINPLVSEQDKKILSYYTLIIALSDEIVALKRRVNEFTALQDGSTTGDAELVDVRNGFSGEVYTTAGEAVREQCAKLNRRFDVIHAPLLISWQDGEYYKPSNNTIQTSDDFSRSLPIDVTEYAGLAIEIKSRVNATQGFAFRNANQSVIEYFDGEKASSSGIDRGYPAVTIEVPENASELIITSLLADKTKCYVRPAVDMITLHKNILALEEYVNAVAEELRNEKNTFADTIYPKLATTWTPGFYVKGSGVLQGNESLSASDYIDVAAFAGMPVEYSCRLGASWGFSFYDVNKTQIASIDTSTHPSSGIITVPELAAYARITAFKDRENESFLRPVPSVGNILNGLNRNGGRLYPLNIAMFGDSIMLGRNGDGDTYLTQYTIPNTVGYMLKCNCANFGVGSMGYVHTGSGMNAYDKINSVDLNQYDVVVLCFGVNDHSQTLGEWNSEDEMTVMGQFNKCVKLVYEKNPNAILVVFGPFNGRNVGGFPNYWFGQSWFEIDELLKTACDYYSVPYITQKNGPVNSYTIRTFIGADGVHPSNLGYKRIGAWFAGQLRNILG